MQFLEHLKKDLERGFDRALAKSQLAFHLEGGRGSSHKGSHHRAGHRVVPTLRIDPKGDIYGSYSADRIAFDKPIRAPFVYASEQYVATGSAGQGWEAYRLVRRDAWKEPVAEYATMDYEAARNSPKGFYHGVVVKHKGGKYVLVGPPVTFAKDKSDKTTKVTKSHVHGHYRTYHGKKVWIQDYYDKRTRKPEPPPKSLKQLKVKVERDASRRKIKPPTVMVSAKPRAVEMKVNTDPRRQWRMQASQAGDDNLLFVGIRETFQNSLDSVFTAMDRGEIDRGEFRVDYDRGAGTMTISDNGIGMDWDTCLDKFLTLAASGKEDEQGAIGGFGVAKAYILGMVDASKAGGGKWTIRSDSFEANSEQIGEPPTTGLEKVRGVTLNFEGIDTKLFDYRLPSTLKYLFGYTDTKGKLDIYLNGQKIEPTQFKPEWEKDLATSEDLPEGLHMNAWLVPTEQSPYRITRLVSPRYGYAMVQTARMWWEIPTDVVVDITSDIRPGNPGYPFDMARLALVGKPSRIEEGIVEGIRQDPYSATIKHEYQTEVFGAKGAGVIEAQERAAAESIEKDVGLADAVEEIAEIVTSAIRPAPEQGGLTGEEFDAALQALVAKTGSENAPMKLIDAIREQVRATPVSLRESPIGKAFVVKLGSEDMKAKGFTLTGARLRELVAWDAINHLICNQLVSTGEMQEEQAREWKPGFVIKADVKAMNTIEEYEPDIAAALGKSKERLLLFNPTAVKGETPEEKAMWLRDLACHEIAHFYAGWHNEEFTTAEGLIHEATLPIVNRILAVGRAAFRKGGVARGGSRGPRRPARSVQRRLELSLRKMIGGRA